MGISNRRSVLQALSAFAAMPLLTLPARAAAAGKSVHFPSGAIHLTRILERDLAGGALIRVARRWECEFLPLGAGSRVQARQTETRVDAPPALAALAKMEEQREVSGLFPAELDRNGVMVGWPEPRDDSIKIAVSRAIDKIAAAVPPSGEMRSAQEFLSGIGNAAAQVVSQVPRDLFFPDTGRRAVRQPMTLPGGLEASYEVTIESAAQSASGLLDYSQRRVVTQIGEDSRTTLERWETEPAGG